MARVSDYQLTVTLAVGQRWRDKQTGKVREVVSLQEYQVIGKTVAVEYVGGSLAYEWPEREFLDAHELVTE